ncbi:MAG TPA: hypothetical protein VN802_01640 [Stellaceae bacterium]|nr:hypothetical protein [Stellaceae bacterium]
MAINPALIGKAGELLVAAELMRRGIEVAHPASDVGVDILAYRLDFKQTVPGKVVPIQVKTRSASGYNFQRSWFHRCPGVVLVHVWNVATQPEFYVLESLKRVEEALGPVHAASASWQTNGVYNVTDPGEEAHKRMQAHRDKWERITAQLATSPVLTG